MSLNPTGETKVDPAHLERNDFVCALGLHVSILVIFTILTLWRPHTLPEPPKSVQVQLISPAELQKMTAKPSPPKPVVKPRKVKKPKLRKKPKVKPKPWPKPKPALKPKPKPKPKPKVKSKPKTAVKSKPQDDFDPFQPLVGTRKAQSSRPKKGLASAQREQLSQRELDRYIQKIQEAVLQHWKVPANSSDIKQDPEVQMDLNRDGSVKKVKIIISSGSPALDYSLIRAIEAAQPFVLPRQQFEVFRNNRIRFHPLK